MENDTDCMKRRLLYAASQTYQPEMEVLHRQVEWIGSPIVIRRQVERQPLDLALVGRVREGVLIAFRGSLAPFHGGRHAGWASLLEWLDDGVALCVEDRIYGGGVHFGFAESMRRLWADRDGTPGVASAVQALLDLGARRHLFVTGHGKGGALANLAGLRAARHEPWADLPISVATFAAARAGDAAFARSYAGTRILCLRYEVSADPVPHLPPSNASPAWARRLARLACTGLRRGDWQPVGKRVSVDPVRKPWPRRLLARMRGADLVLLTPAAIAAHSICPSSPYDRLVCLGEPDCNHGRETIRILPGRRAA